MNNYPSYVYSFQFFTSDTPRVFRFESMSYYYSTILAEGRQFFSGGGEAHILFSRSIVYKCVLADSTVLAMFTFHHNFKI
jgi:hypothetical protein